MTTSQEVDSVLLAKIFKEYKCNFFQFPTKASIKTLVKYMKIGDIDMLLYLFPDYMPAIVKYYEVFEHYEKCSFIINKSKQKKVKIDFKLEDC